MLSSRKVCVEGGAFQGKARCSLFICCGKCESHQTSESLPHPSYSFYQKTHELSRERLYYGISLNQPNQAGKPSEKNNEACLDSQCYFYHSYLEGYKRGRAQLKQRWLQASPSKSVCFGRAWAMANL